MDFAAKSGHLQIIEYLNMYRGEKCTDWAMLYAAGLNHFEIVKYLHEHAGIQCTAKAMNKAAEVGNLGIVRYMCENDLESVNVQSALVVAGDTGQEHVVAYLKSL